ncbi:SHOCT-like domain-containing protein [Dactylosporangium sp. CA-233914]|uniref:SHOCT-like domain-containing protein n=1 Tax=Dactylosporangium sp. CA-233914 TaxID=3239934 RepID=UPI003D8CED75
MNEERKEILQMLAEGKITTDEADQLIEALERVQPVPVAAGSDVRPKGKPKYLRVMVDANDDGTPSRVNIRVPLQLLRAGVRLAALIPPQALGQANAELARSGVPFDLTQLKPEQLEELIEQLDDMTVEVDQLDTQVRVFCE